MSSNGGESNHIATMQEVLPSPLESNQRPLTRNLVHKLTTGAAANLVSNPDLEDHKTDGGANGASLGG